MCNSNESSLHRSERDVARPAVDRVVKAVVETLVMAAKVAILGFVFVRFHASWIGLSVVLGMAILLFRLDRAIVRWAASAAGLRR